MKQAIPLRCFEAVAVVANKWLLIVQGSEWGIYNFCHG